MKENTLEEIVNNSGSFGKMNILLSYNEPSQCFEATYNDLISLFEPDEINCSLFDLESQDIIDISIPKFPIQNSNSIIRVIFVKEKEKMSIEYFNNRFMLEHFFRPNNFQSVKGYSIIEKFRTEKNNPKLVLGFEVEIFSDSYESSLRENISDKSLHPIYVVKSDVRNGYVIEKYESDTSDINDQKVKFIQEYLRLIGISQASL